LHAVEVCILLTTPNSCITSCLKCTSETICLCLPMVTTVPSGSSYRPSAGGRFSSKPTSATSHSDFLASSTTSSIQTLWKSGVYSMSVRRTNSYPDLFDEEDPTPACDRDPDAAPDDDGRAASPAEEALPSLVSIPSPPPAAAFPFLGTRFSSMRGQMARSGSCPDLRITSDRPAVTACPPTSLIIMDSARGERGGRGGWRCEGKREGDGGTVSV
jgi:hypothetical protein